MISSSVVRFSLMFTVAATELDATAMVRVDFVISWFSLSMIGVF